MNTFTLSLIVIGYLLSLAYLGFLGYKKTTSTSDYLVGGRQMNPIVMALSYGATFISASAIVGFGEWLPLLVWVSSGSVSSICLSGLLLLLSFLVCAPGVWGLN